MKTTARFNGPLPLAEAMSKLILTPLEDARFSREVQDPGERQRRHLPADQNLDRLRGWRIGFRDRRKTRETVQGLPPALRPLAGLRRGADEDERHLRARRDAELRPR